jgi:hypothetical protein
MGILPCLGSVTVVTGESRCGWVAKIFCISGAESEVREKKSCISGVGSGGAGETEGEMMRMMDEVEDADERMERCVVFVDAWKENDCRRG